MSITYRDIKGIPLTSDEVDENFRNLDGRLRTLESSHESAEVISTIEQEFNTIKFISNKGRQVGNVTIPIARLNPMGAWKPGVKYAKNDLVANGNGLIWICITPHTSADWSKEESNWVLFFKFNGG